MKTLKSGSRYLVVVNRDNTDVSIIDQKLKDAGISATVFGIWHAKENIDIYEIKLPLWKRWF
jgi:hypothetical protein